MMRTERRRPDSRNMRAMAGDLSEEEQAQPDALRAQIDALHGSEG